MTSEDVVKYFQANYFDPREALNDPNINTKFEKSLKRMLSNRNVKRGYKKAFANDRIYSYFQDTIASALRSQIQQEFKETPRSDLSLEELEKLRKRRVWGAQYFE